MNSNSFRPPGVNAGITLDDVLEAAVVRIEEHGVDTLTMRRLATALKVTPMSIYRHVANKHELLSLVADQYLDSMSLPEETSDWRAYLEEWLAALHDLTLQHPVLAHVFVQQPLDGPIGWKLADQVFGVLHQHGFTAKEAGELFSALLAFTIGFALVKLARATERGERPTPTDERLAAYPNLGEAIGFYDVWLEDASFRRGVRGLIAGHPVAQQRG